MTRRWGWSSRQTSIAVSPGGHLWRKTVPEGRSLTSESALPTHPAALAPEVLLADCRARRTRRSGPGGQHRNKVETAVVLTHLPSGVTAEANERRSQHENHAQAVFRLRVKLALGVRLPAGSPSALWQARRRSGRIAVNSQHEDFPALLAEALDALEASSASATEAAVALGVTASQLVKLLKQEPAALAQVNATRVAKGLRVLK